MVDLDGYNELMMGNGEHQVFTLQRVHQSISGQFQIALRDAKLSMTHPSRIEYKDQVFAEPKRVGGVPPLLSRCQGKQDSSVYRQIEYSYD